MTITRIPSKKPLKKRSFRLWYERAMALIILFNYILVIFDLTYIPMRDFWLQGKFQMVFVKFNQPVDFLVFKVDNLELKFPPKNPFRIIPPQLSQWIIQTYDPIKGIVPYRSTQEYLAIVQNLEQEIKDINQRFSEQSLQALPSNSTSKATNDFAQSQTEIEMLLARLRAESVEIIDTNPFQVANKTGTLERIKNEITHHIYGSKDNSHSAKEAFRKFWSKDYLFQDGFISYVNEMAFFNKKIAPLVRTNYFRPIGENGEPIDNFGALDFPFGVLFLLEFLIRTWLIGRRHAGLSWFDAMLWRWYDVFLFIPIVRWLRIIPLIIRLNQARLINLKAIQRQASQGFVATIAGDVTEVVVLRIVNQFQAAINEGFVRDFFEQQGKKSYIDINDTDEIAEIIKLVVDITVNKVLPDIRPEAEAFLKYNLDQALQQAPAYQGLQRLPGVKSLETQLTEQMTTRFYSTLCHVLADMTKEDPVFDELVSKLAYSFNHSMGTELKAEHSMERLEFLLKDLLEEIKINYVQKLSQEDVEDILEQTRKLRQGKDTTISLTPSQH